MSNDLNTALEDFCNSISDFIEFYSNEPKFIRRNGRLEFLDISLPYMKKEAKELDTYKRLYAILSEDSILKNAERKIGAWGSPETIIEEMIKRSVRVLENRVKVKPNMARSYLEKFKKLLLLKEMNYTIFRRIIGLEIIPPRIELDKETVLVQLSEKELNERMPCLSMLEIGMPYLDLTQHPVELRCVVTQPVKDVDLEFLYPSDETKSKLLERCEIVLTTLLLTKTGMLELGPYSFKLLLEEDLFEQFTMNKQFVLPVYPSKIIIDKEDVELLKSSYIAATKICQEASVIHYALKRFILGSKRVNPEDKLIDYVIAWESLLLTVDGKQVKGELSYRFGLNGSSLLHWIPDGLSREDAFILMRAAYECRSIIVHRGGNQKELKKTLSKVQVATVEELSDLLGKYLRKTILWMANIEENKRPYKERGGWEKLLWSNPA